MPSVQYDSEVDICNRALSHLNISQGIQSIDPPDQSQNAQAAAFWYPRSRDLALKMAPWDFADVTAVLASDPTVYPGFCYAYQYPIDCLQVVAVTTQYGLRYGTNYWGNYWGYQQYWQSGMQKIPTRVVQSQQSGKAILCDLPSPAYVMYIQAVEDTSLFDPIFIEFLSHLLASKLAGTLRADVKKVQAETQAAEMWRLQAIAQFLNQSQQDRERDSPSILVR